jgi:hypothetical protein
METYFDLLNQHCQYNYDHCAKDHLSRAFTMELAYRKVSEKENPIIVELGTTRSFVHGGLEGCMNPNPKYWQPDNPSTWDWGAGSFTRVFAEIGCTLHTVDIVANHINICRKICEEYPNVEYHVSDSVNFLLQLDDKADLVYMDTGDMNPLEASAKLHLREAECIVARGIVPIGGLILIDDVRNPVPIKEFGEKSLFGKAKYSLGFLLANGFDILMDEYQMLLIRKR